MLSRPIPAIFWMFTLSLLLFIFSCRKSEMIDTSQGIRLDFSTDTVIFDTVFTSIGSITKQLRVHNNNDKKVSISSIRLAGGSKSNFALNINGVPTDDASNVEIPAHDSIFVLVKVTVDPNNQTNPMLITDSIVFTLNGNLQDVKLVAWGQDAVFHINQELSGQVIWDSVKPHVIYGYVRMDTSSSLTILAGTKVYLHFNSRLDILHLASLKITGNLEHPVRFQGDRLDEFYRDLPGQWSGIYLEKGSLGNEIDYAVIKNGLYGILIDSASTYAVPMLKLDNTIIRNITFDGIYAYASCIVSTNCVVGDCGTSAITMNFGGSYDFRQLTVGNYWGSSVRLGPSVYASNYTYGSTGSITYNGLVKAYFGNAIIYGNEQEELGLDMKPGADSVYNFDHCILLTQKNLSLSPTSFIECLANQDPLFKDVVNYDYRIDSLSPARDKGIPMGVTFDILGKDRGSTPDLGAYEWIPGQ